MAATKKAQANKIKAEKAPAKPKRNSKGQFVKGVPRSPAAGRKKGVPNKIRTELKEVVFQALDNVGGVEYLERVAIARPEVFCALLGKVAPKEVNANVNIVDEFARRMAAADARIKDYIEGEYSE